MKRKKDHKQKDALDLSVKCQNKVFNMTFKCFVCWKYVLIQLWIIELEREREKISVRKPGCFRLLSHLSIVNCNYVNILCLQFLFNFISFKTMYFT